MLRTASSPSSGSISRAAASFRERTPSFWKAVERWLLTVLSARNSRFAIWRFPKPWTTMARTSFSRCEKTGLTTQRWNRRGSEICPTSTDWVTGPRVDSRSDSKTTPSAPALSACRSPAPSESDETTTR